MSDLPTNIWRVTCGDHEQVVSEMMAAPNEGCYAKADPDALLEFYYNERSAVLRALDWAGADMAEAECMETEDLWTLLEDTIESTGEYILVVSLPISAEVHDVVTTN